MKICLINLSPYIYQARQWIFNKSLFYFYHFKNSSDHAITKNVLKSILYTLERLLYSSLPLFWCFPATNQFNFYFLHLLRLEHLKKIKQYMSTLLYLQIKYKLHNLSKLPRKKNWCEGGYLYSMVEGWWWWYWWGLLYGGRPPMIFVV